MMRIVYLDVIEVYFDFRGKGIGRVIIEYIEGSFVGKVEFLII